MAVQDVMIYISNKCDLQRLLGVLSSDKRVWVQDFGRILVLLRITLDKWNEYVLVCQDPDED